MQEVLGILIHANVGMYFLISAATWFACNDLTTDADQITSASSVVAMQPEDMLNLAEMLQKSQGKTLSVHSKETGRQQCIHRPWQYRPYCLYYG